MYCPDGGFSTKAEATSFSVVGRTEDGMPGGGPEPKGLPIHELARGRGGEMAYFLEFAGSICKKSEQLSE